jgi:hypothetical protein
MGLSCWEASSERACKTDALAGSSDQACLSAAAWSLVWRAAIRSNAEIIGEKNNAITDILQVVDENFASSVNNRRGQRGDKQ